MLCFGQLSVDFNLGRDADRYICMGMSVFLAVDVPLVCGRWGLGGEHRWDGPSQGCVHPAAMSPWLDGMGLRAVSPGLMSACFVTVSVVSQAKNPMPCCGKSL